MKITPAEVKPTRPLAARGVPKAAPTPAELREWAENPSEEKRRLIQEAMRIMMSAPSSSARDARESSPRESRPASSGLWWPCSTCDFVLPGDGDGGRDRPECPLCGLVTSELPYNYDHGDDSELPQSGSPQTPSPPSQSAPSPGAGPRETEIRCHDCPETNQASFSKRAFRLARDLAAGIGRSRTLEDVRCKACAARFDFETKLKQRRLADEIDIPCMDCGDFFPLAVYSRSQRLKPAETRRCPGCADVQKEAIALVWQRMQEPSGAVPVRIAEPTAASSAQDEPAPE